MTTASSTLRTRSLLSWLAAFNTSASQPLVEALASSESEDEALKTLRDGVILYQVLDLLYQGNFASSSTSDLEPQVRHPLAIKVPISLDSCTLSLLHHHHNHPPFATISGRHSLLLEPSLACLDDAIIIIIQHSHL